MSAVLFALGCITIGFVGGMIGRKIMNTNQITPATEFNFTYGEIDSNDLKEKLVDDKETESSDN